MAKYLFQVSYTREGLNGLLKEGASSRLGFVKQLTADMGGSLEAFYYAFGDNDAYVISDLPDHETAAAVSLAINASGAATIKTVVLMTVEEVDRATKQTVNYRPPGA